MRGVPLPTKSGLCAVGFFGLEQDFALDHDSLVAAHACDVAKATAVLVRVVVDAIHIVVLLGRLFDRVVQLEVLFEHFVLPLVAHFAQTLACGLP